MEYILSAKRNGCPFCDELEKTDGLENLIIYRADHSFVILNRYPYTSGHLMVVPYLHCSSLSGLNKEIRSEMMELTAKAVDVLQSVYLPQGFNIGVNMGEVAGAGVLDHIHIHVVPRWNGDTNFMSTVAQTRLLAELLETGYGRVKEGWERKFQQ